MVHMVRKCVPFHTHTELLRYLKVDVCFLPRESEGGERSKEWNCSNWSRGTAEITVCKSMYSCVNLKKKNDLTT